MDHPPDALLEGFRISATSRYLWVAGYMWALYDWLISLDQEFNIIVVLQSNWSVEFCKVYWYLLGGIGLGQMCAAQGALLLRLSVMYRRSFKVMATSIILFVIELVSMVTIWFVDIHDSIGLVFETYMWILTWFSAYSHWKTSGARRPNILTILIRDSLLWYFFLGVALFLNAMAFITGQEMLVVVGTVAMQTTATIGGSRFLLNLQAAYFLLTGHATSTRTAYSRSTGYTGTEGTVGVFRPALSDMKDEDDDGGGDEAGSIGMGVWVNNDTLDGRPASPPAIMLQPIRPGGKRERTYSTLGSSSIGLREPDNVEGQEVSGSDLSQPAHSSTKLWRPQPTISDADTI
ncbi:hypothetical protein FS837_001718 [Tulasnella sp. UAMH 9824]|nr:hypothetical protein FS837_001718 [Tulasnella sp. UAMH 9824]